MIDTHIHCVPPNLPGVGPLSPRLLESVPAVAELVRAQMQAGGFTITLAMGSLSDRDEDPLGISRTLEIAALVPGLHAIGAINPLQTDPEHLWRVDDLLAAHKVVALKGYLGYVHCYPSDPGYRPYYELAAKYKVPVIFHTGDTYSPSAKLKYAHPLGVDEVAVDHRDVRFVLAHVGNPWMIDAAEVVYKNVNVWADLSGLFVGDDETLSDVESHLAIEETLERVRTAFCYAERPNRFLFGSDWPLAPMPLYRDYLMKTIPERHRDQVFEGNARALFFGAK